MFFSIPSSLKRRNKEKYFKTMTVKNKMSKAQHIRKTHYSVYRSPDAGELTVLALQRVIGHVKDTLNGNIYFRMYIQIVNAEKITSEVRRIPLAVHII